MDLPVKTDDALGQPTRARRFALLGELKRPAGTQELAERLDLHPNGVRLHLERMREAGLVVRERTRQARGRARDMWLTAPDASPGGDPPTSYADLGRWPARAIAPGETTLQHIEETGHEIGRGLAPASGGASAEEMLDELAPRAELTGFVPRDPYEAGCLVEVRGALADEEPAAGE